MPQVRRHPVLVPVRAVGQGGPAAEEEQMIRRPPLRRAAFALALPAVLGAVRAGAAIGTTETMSVTISDGLDARGMSTTVSSPSD